ncbi:MAG: hypothetical protein WC364_14505 [Eubacteriales bacterium]|jgi:hypothetical protein
MNKVLFSKKAQNITELALIIGVVAIVFISMEVYFKRSLNAKIKNMADNYITGDVFGGGKLEGIAKQEAYEIDTHNFVKQESITPMRATASIVSITSPGGGKVEESEQKVYIGSPEKPATSESKVIY